MPPAIVGALDTPPRDVANATSRSAPTSSHVRRGDIRVVHPLLHQGGDARLALVLRFDATREFAEILLVHSTPELATDIDGVLDRRIGLAPYDVVLQSDLRGVVWTNQLGKRIAHAPEPIFASLNQIARGEASGSEGGSLRRGTPLAGPVDRRWSFKEGEGRSLQRLTADCTETLLGGTSPWEVDAGLFNPRLLAVIDDQESLILELMHLLTTRDLKLTIDDIQTLSDMGALELDPWLALGNGLDLWNSFQQVIESAVTTTEDGSTGHHVRLITAEQVMGSSTIDERYTEVHVIGQKDTAFA